MVGDMMTEFLIRKSMLEQYVRCSYAFKLKFVDGRVDENELPTGQYAGLGTRFHEWAHVFFQFACTVDPLQWEQLIPKEFSALEKQWARWFIQFEWRRWWLLKQAGRLDEWQPVYKELTLESTKYGITGTIDRVDWKDKSKNEVVLIEYKTTLGMDYTSLRRQLHFYKLLYENADEVTIGKVTGIACINPRLRKVWYEDVNANSMRAVERWLNRIKLSLETGQFKPTNNQYVCMWCDVADVCEYWCEFEKEAK